MMRVIVGVVVVWLIVSIPVALIVGAVLHHASRHEAADLTPAPTPASADPARQVDRHRAAG
jgi:hypothetical protein